MKTIASETNRRNAWALLAASIVASGTGCSPVVLATPPVPPKTIPELRVEPGPVPEKSGRVVLDSVGVASNVVEILDESSAVAYAGAYRASAHGETTRPVCVTPCAADLPLGAHRLRFAPIGDEDDGETNVMVDVGAKPSVFRVTPARRHVNEGGQFAGTLLATLGGTGMVLGGAMLGAAETSSDGRKIDWRSPETITIGAGAATLALGILIHALSRGEVRRESVVQWTPGASPGGGMTAGTAR